MRRFSLAAVTVFWVHVGLTGRTLPAEEQAHEVGGPLAGLVLPAFPAQHGEQPGYPGSIPELSEKGETLVDMGHEYRQWGPQGQASQKQLYDGSVEHWRAYMFKYMPVRSFFDRQSQIRNFRAPDLPGVEPSQVEEYAEPVYWVPRHAEPRFTGRKRKPVPVVRMKVDSPVVRLDLGELDEGLYAVRVIGAVETSQLRPFRRPLCMRMTVNDGLQGESNEYRLRLGYCDEFYSVAEFYFHAPVWRHYQAELKVDHGSAVDLLVHNVSLDDVLSGTVRGAVKTGTTIASAMPAARAALARRKEEGHQVPEPLSQEKRLARDAAIWNAFPPVNAQGSTIAVGRGGYGSVKGVAAGTQKLTGDRIVDQYGPPYALRLAAGRRDRPGPAGQSPATVPRIGPP